MIFSSLLGPLSIKLLYFTAYFFQNLDPFFAIKLFVVLPNLWFEKIKALSNYINVRLVPCLVE